MYFNSSDCNFNDPKSHCDNINMDQTCLICFSDSLNFDKSASDRHILFDTCCKYLHSAITKGVVLGQAQDDVPNFCNRCFESADQLADLTNKLEVFQKTISEYILMFSLEILQRRAIPYQKAENIEVFGKKLVMCDLSDLNDVKETSTRSQENGVSLDFPPDSLESGTSNFEGNTEQNIVGDRLIIPDEPAATNFVTFESIIKTETFDNDLFIQNYDQADIGEFQITKLEGVAHYQENMLKEQSLQKPPRSQRTGKRVTNKLNLIPFVKLKRLKLPGTTNTAAETENGRTNPFSIGAVKVYDNELLLIQSQKALSDVDTAMSILTTKMGSVQQSCDIPRYRPRSNKELDPDFEITKRQYKNKHGKNAKYEPLTGYEITAAIERPFQCPICQKTFSDKHSLQYHIKAIHTNEKPFKCTHCSMRFLHRGNLNVHLKTHPGANPYKCKACSTRFKTFQALKRHFNSDHTKEKFSSPRKTIVHNGVKGTYPCSVCRKEFTTKYYLISHLRLHTGEKPYTCTLCSQTFRHQSNLYVHKKRCKNDHKNVDNPPLVNTPVESLAENGNPLECSVCHKQFTSMQMLSSHVRRHTVERPYKCSKCNRTFQFQSSHIVHMKRRHAHAPILKNEYSKHPKERGDPARPFQCLECSKKFSSQSNLVSHFRMHTGEKPFQCSICNKSFRHKNVLKKHVCKNIDLITGANEEEMEIPSPAVDPLMFVETFTAEKEIRINDTITTEKFNACQCSECGKTFTTKTCLEIHFRIHSGEKPFKCDQCDYACTQGANLAKHKLHRHSTLCQFKCRDCGRPFKTAGMIKQHYKRVHFAIDFTNECILENADIEEES